MTEMAWRVASDRAPQNPQGIGDTKSRSHAVIPLSSPGTRQVLCEALCIPIPPTLSVHGKEGMSCVTRAALRPLCIAHRWSSRCQPRPLDSEPQRQARNPFCACRDRVLGPEGSASLCPPSPWWPLSRGTFRLPGTQSLVL